RRIVADIDRRSAPIQRLIFAREIIVGPQDFFGLSIEARVRAILSPRSNLRREVFQGAARDFGFARAFPGVDNSTAKQYRDKQNPKSNCVASSFHRHQRFALLSPRSGRSEIAQQFTAGYRGLMKIPSP